MWKSKRVSTIAGILVVSLGCVFLSVGDGMGQSFPNRPVTIIVPFTAGGSTDVVTRSIAGAAEKKLGVPLIIANRAGAGGVIGMTELARSKPDGYTLGTMSIGSATVIPQMQKVSYNAATDFEYICGFTAYTYGVFVKANSRFKNLGDVIKEARANPGKITYGTMSTYVQLALKAVEHQEKIKMTYVPFGSGAEATASLVGGHIDIGIISTDAHKFLESKEIRMLASAAPKRWADLPDVPTMKELGYDVDVTSWTAMGAPAGVAKAQLNIFEEAFKAAHANPEVKSFFEKLDAAAPFMSGEEIKKFYMKKQVDVKPLIEAVKADQKKK